MTKLRSLLSLCLLAGTALCVPSWSDSLFDPQTMMEISEIHRGDRAVGKTVFAGTEISEFRLEIIDIMAKANMGSDMILARVLDGPVVARQSGIIGGMSGSPVYIGGRLIGAVAWGWGFQKEPITGITPIRAMLGAMEMMDEAPQASLAAPLKWRASRPLLIDGARYTAAQVLRPGEQVAAGVLGLRPVGTPINCNGMGPRTLQLAQRRLGAYGALPCAGGGGATTPVPVDLVPGAAVGVRFMQGDFDMTGIGTVTYRKGDKLIAFGHPMMQLGKVALPMSTAWINDFMPSYEHSNKMGSGMTNIGTLRSDMPFAVGGQIGPEAPLIPAHLEVTDTLRNSRRVYNLQVMRERGLTPLLLALGISSALEATYNPSRPGIVRTRFELKGEGGATISRENQFYMQSSPDRIATSEVMDLMGLLEDNRWKPQGIAELNFRADIIERDDTALVERLYVEENVAKAGKPLTVHVLLRPTGGELRDEVFTLNMPLDLPKGTLRLAVCGGQDSMYFRSRMGLMVPDFDGLDPLLDYVARLEQGKQLCVMAALPSSGLAFGTTCLRHLPPSVSAVFEKTSRTDLNQGKDELLTSREFPYVVFGREMISLTTEDRQGTKGTPASSSAGTSAGTGKSSSDSSSKSREADDDSTGPTLNSLWWAAACFRPAVAERLRREAADRGLTFTASETPPPPPPAKAAATDKSKADAEEDEKGKDEAKKETTTEEEAEAVVRQPSVWTQTKAEDFTSGESKGTAISSAGAVLTAPTVTSLGKLDELQVWGALATPTATYLATAAPARVYKLMDDKPKLWFDCHAFAARALAVDGAGNLYVGTWPEATIYKITPDGSGSVFVKLPCDYVWALAFDSEGRLLAGTGPAGQLFQIDASGQATDLVRLPQAHILSLLPTASGLYLGTGDKGLLYKLLPNRQLLAIVDTDTDDLTALTADAAGNVYAATAPNGKVFRLDGDTATTLFDDKTQPVYALAACGGKLYAATGTEGKLLTVSAEAYETLADNPATHLLCLSAADNHSLIVGTGNVGEVLRVTGGQATEGTFTSSVFDAKRPARWSALRWQGTVPEGGELVLQTRSGNSQDPDDGSWSGWQAPSGPAANQQVTSPAARYLQYRALLKQSAGGASPVLRRLSVSYLPANQKPTVEFDDFDQDTPLSGKAEITWDATDPDKDEMIATVQYRPAGGGNWTEIAEVNADDSSCDWETTKLTDGLYEVRVLVSDEVSNPGAALSSEVIAYGVRLDNTPPDLSFQKVYVQDGRLIVEGLASDNTALAEVSYQVGTQWRGATPVDGAYDSQYEQFRLAVALKEGKAEVDVRAQDTAGNTLTKSVSWPLEEERTARPEGKSRK